MDSEGNGGLQRFSAAGKTLPNPRLHSRPIIDGASSESLKHTLSAHHSDPRRQHTLVIQGGSQSSQERGVPFTNSNWGRKTIWTLPSEVQDYINEAYMDSMYGDCVSGNRFCQYEPAWPHDQQSMPVRPFYSPQSGKDANTILCQILEPLEECFAQPQSTNVAGLLEKLRKERRTRLSKQKYHRSGAIYRNNPDAALELNVHSLLNRVRLAVQRDRLDLAEALGRKAVGLAAKLECGPITAKCWYWQGVIADKQQEKEVAAEAFLLALSCVGKYAEGESMPKYVEAYEELILDVLQRQCPGQFDRDMWCANLREAAQGYTFGLLAEPTSFSDQTAASRTSRHSAPANGALPKPHPNPRPDADLGRSGRNILGLGINIPAVVKQSPVLDRRARSPPSRASKRSASMMGAREGLQSTPTSSGFIFSDHPSAVPIPLGKRPHRAESTRSEQASEPPTPLGKRRSHLRRSFRSVGRRDFSREFSDGTDTKDLEALMSRVMLQAWNLPEVPVSQKQSPVPARLSQTSQQTTPSTPPSANMTPSPRSKPLPAGAENSAAVVELFDRAMSTGSGIELGTSAQHSPLSRASFFGGWKPLKTVSTASTPSTPSTSSPWEGAWVSRLDARLAEMEAPSPGAYYSSRPCSIHLDFVNPFSPNYISIRSPRPSPSSSNISPFSSPPPRSAAFERSAPRKSSSPTPLDTDIKRVSFTTPHAGQRTRSGSVSEPSSPSPLRESSTIDEQQDTETETSQEQMNLPPFEELLNATPKSPPRPAPPPGTSPPSTAPAAPPSKPPPSQVNTRTPNWRSATSSTQPRRPSRIPIASSGRSPTPAHAVRGVPRSPPLPMPAPLKPTPEARPNPLRKQAPTGKGSGSKGVASMPRADSKSRESSQSEAEKRRLKPSPLRRKGPVGKGREGER